MLNNISSPVLNISVDVLKDLDGTEALASLWFLFSKCQSSLNEGRRLEYISWRLWSQRIAGKSLKYRPLTPDSPSDGVSSLGSGTTSRFVFKDARTGRSHQQLIGKILADFIPSSPHTSQSLHPRLLLPGKPSKAELEIENASVLPTPAAESSLSISVIPPAHSNGEADSRPTTMIIATTAVPAQISGGSTTSATPKSVSPIIGSHASPLQSNLSSSNSGSNALASPFPLVVVVNPTPNPTPHPTPPATPVLPPILGPDAVGHTHVPLPPRMSPDSPSLPRDRRQPNLALTTALDPIPAYQTRLSIHSTVTPIPTNLLPPSPSGNTSSSVTSTSSINSNSSHLTTSSTTSIHSNDTRALNATLKPHDARKFFLKHDEHSSGSSDEPSPVRPDLATFTAHGSDASSNRVGSSPGNSPAVGSYSPGIESRNGDSDHLPNGAIHPHSGGLDSIPVTGSWGESDTSDRRPHGESSSAKSNKSSGRGSSTGRLSGSSDSRSRSRSHGRTHDGLMMMTSRKKAHASFVSGRRSHRLGANAAPTQAHTRAQGQVVSEDLLQFGTASSSAYEHNRSEEKATKVHSSQQQSRTVAPYPPRPTQVPSSMQNTTQAKRAMFNIGSQSPSGSPSNTDLSTSSQAKGRSPLFVSAGSTEPPKTHPAPSGSKLPSQDRIPPPTSHAPPKAYPPTHEAPPPITSPRLPRGLPHATSNLSAAEAVIQAPRTKRVVLADDDDDDWDETETDLDFDSEFEDDRKSDIDAEKGGTLVESGLAADSGNIEGGDEGGDEGDWISEEDTGSNKVVSNKKAKVSAPPPTSPPPPAPAPAESNTNRRPGVSRHQSQPNILTSATTSKQKQPQPPQPHPEPHQQPAPARPDQRSQFRPGPSRTSSRRGEHKHLQDLEQKLRDAALEAQRQRELFTKVPKRNYSNLTTRSRSGLLSQLMNPDPNIFPGDHPYRRGYSSGDVAVGGRNGSGIARLGIQPMSSITGNQETRSAVSNLTNGAPRPSAARPPPPAAATDISHNAGPTASGVSKIAPLKPTKSAVALPVANSVTASSYKGDLNLLAEKVKGKGKERQKEPNGSAGGYRPKGRPQDEEMEDESEDDREAYNISKSVVEKLAAFADRQTAKKGSGSSRAGPPPALPLQSNLVAVPHPQRSQTHPEPASTTPVQVPQPLGFPYNLPPAAPPSSPRTTRQLMLRDEMSESFRHNLVWFRKVNKDEFAGPRRKSSSALSPRLQPLTAFPTVVHLTEKKKPEVGGINPQETVVEETRAEDLMDEMRPMKMQRNRSWAGGGR
ncbi:hypothetical protein EV361DRAFT_853426 [Lentinula raphanica]|nr:hypothetical protein EV361DRAFT_853426 [Lentinula raphanica]